MHANVGMWWKIAAIEEKGYVGKWELGIRVKQKKYGVDNHSKMEGTGSDGCKGELDSD